MKPLKAREDSHRANFKIEFYAKNWRLDIISYHHSIQWRHRQAGYAKILLQHMSCHTLKHTDIKTMEPLKAR